MTFYLNEKKKNIIISCDLVQKIHEKNEIFNTFLLSEVLLTSTGLIQACEGAI
jgi:hypothetical protein